LAIVFLYLAFKGTNVNDLLDSFRQINYGWLFLLIPVHLLSQILRSYRWRYLLKPIKEEIRFRNLFAAAMIGLLINNGLPRVGELARGFVLGMSEKISRSSVFGTVVIERIVDMITFGFIVCCVVVLSPDSIDALVENANFVRPLFLFGAIGLLVVFTSVFLKSETVFALMKKFLPFVPHRFRPKIERIMNSFLSGLGVAKMRKYFIPIFILSSLTWITYAFALYIPFFMLEGIRQHALDLDAAFILLTVSAIAFVLPAPGAFGTYHSFISFALVRLYGIDPVIALTYSIISHEIGAILNSAIGLFYFINDHVKLSDLKEATTSNGNNGTT
jgi:hypothetical protein